MDIKGDIRRSLEIFIGYLIGYYLDKLKISFLEIMWICQDIKGYHVDILLGDVIGDRGR